MILLSIADASRFANVPAGTIRRWMADGQIDRHGRTKPYKVDLRRVEELRDESRTRRVSAS